ncbi:recombinase B [Picosynechococcus sp. PCC 7003]|uniref:TM0106 family RecB-like putative nuclease n=1 Tax=Picosynechococcus sp. PCC 7003 TaxID=374981 RepID=UPI000810863E|nr:TM0106 family RecB-like putative nuclease [Picosynechococcus sp. PCC 7003]ANV85148.1 recombinase B [Picosynechococcus sp. PCC 7003]
MLLSDDLLLNFKRCERRAFLDLYGDRTEQTSEKDFLQKLRKENQRQIQEYLGQRPYHEPEADDWETCAAETEALMAAGVECIYRGVLLYHFDQWPGTPIEQLTLVGKPTVLLRQPGPSRWGKWHYRPVSVKLGQKPKPEYKLVAMFHSFLLEAIQGRSPRLTQLILRARRPHRVDVDLWADKLQETVTDCINLLLPELEPEVFISRQRCHLCSWHNHCYAIAQADNHLSLVPGVTPNRYESLQGIGVNTLESLAQTSPKHLGQHLGADIAMQLQQQARAIVHQEVVWRINRPNKTQPIPQGTVELFFDIEAEPDRNVDYLLGVYLVDQQNQREKFYGFVAETLEEEGKIWQEFVEFVTQFPEAPIFHFSPYERDTLNRLGKKYGTPPQQLQKIVGRLMDIHQWVTKYLVFPVESYSLKALANCLGYQWREQGVSGDQTVCWYDQWLETGDHQLLEAIVRYNEDDCRATHHLKQWITTFLESQQKTMVLR